MSRNFVFLVAVAVLVGVGVAPAVGGGSWLQSPARYYQPGDDVTLVGYTEHGAWVDAGPWLGFISARPWDSEHGTSDLGMVEVGEAMIEPTPLGGYLAYRVSVEFTLPNDLEPGSYGVAVRNAAGEAPGDIGGGGIAVGVPEDMEPRYLEWALDDPLVAELAEDEVIAGPGFAVTVADLRRGEYPPDAALYMLDPSVLPPTTTTSPPRTTTSATSLEDPLALPSIEAALPPHEVIAASTVSAASIPTVSPQGDEPSASARVGATVLAATALTFLVAVWIGRRSLRRSGRRGTRRGSVTTTGRGGT